MRTWSQVLNKLMFYFSLSLGKIKTDKIISLITRLIVMGNAPLMVLFCNFPLFCKCPLADL